MLGLALRRGRRGSSSRRRRKSRRSKKIAAAEAARRAARLREQERRAAIMRSAMKPPIRAVRRSEDTPKTKTLRRGEETAKRMAVAQAARPKIRHSRSTVHEAQYRKVEGPVRRIARCKSRPTNNRSKGGASKAFVPWCDRRAG